MSAFEVVFSWYVGATLKTRKAILPAESAAMAVRTALAGVPDADPRNLMVRVRPVAMGAA